MRETTNRYEVLSEAERQGTRPTQEAPKGREPQQNPNLPAGVPLYNNFLVAKRENSVVVQPGRVPIGNGAAFGCVVMKEFVKALTEKLTPNSAAHDDYLTCSNNPNEEEVGMTFIAVTVGIRPYPTRSTWGIPTLTGYGADKSNTRKESCGDGVGMDLSAPAPYPYPLRHCICLIILKYNYGNVIYQKDLRVIVK
ncbi:unnamed protein product [Linum trigynum]